MPSATPSTPQPPTNQPPTRPDVPDYHKPFPDLGHEALRIPLAQAIDDLATTTAALQLTTDDLAKTVADVEANQLGVDDAYFLTDLLFNLAGRASDLIDKVSGRAALVVTRIATLEDRIEALEKLAANLPPLNQPPEATP